MPPKVVHSFVRLFLTEKHFLFHCSTPSEVKLGVPLAEVVSIQKAVAMGEAAIQIFTLQRGCVPCPHHDNILCSPGLPVSE